MDFFSTCRYLWYFILLFQVYLVHGTNTVADLFAVLFPKGPLNVLLKLSQERNETIPALIYNGILLYFVTL